MAMRGWRRVWLAVLGFCIALPVIAIGGLYAVRGPYGLNVLWRHGGSYWITVAPDDPRLSAAMRMALAKQPPAVTPGSFAWQRVADGFAMAELPVLADGAEVDRILLARIDPARFRFVVRNAPTGDTDLQGWMTKLGAAIVINGSYYAPRGTPDTPFLSDGIALGPASYDARQGAFVASDAATNIADLSTKDWQSAFQGARDALVSYPLLVGPGGADRTLASRRWLANRSFVGKDIDGNIILGTTKDAFFSLDRLAHFLKAAPLTLDIALNLDGGPVACQGIAVGTYRRDFCGLWEAQENDGKIQLLRWPFGARWSLPIVLAAVPK